MAALPLFFDLQFFENSGAVASSYLLYTYANGTTTPLATYTDASGVTPNANPVVLNSAGRCSLWLQPQAYSFELKTAAGALVKRYDDVEPSVGVSGLGNRVTATLGGGMVGFGISTDYLGTGGAPANVAQAIQEVVGTKTFTLYVATTGNDSNDGSISAPFATLQKAATVITAVGIVGGSRRISVAAGTYSGAARTTRFGPANANESTPVDNYKIDGINSANYIIIDGPDVGYVPASNPEPVPTAIFEGGGAAAVGLQVEGHVKLVVRNIKFQNYSGSSSSAGISGDGAFIRTENVHGSANNIDISNFRGRLEVKGGRLDGATLYSLRSMFLNKHEIGNQSAGAVGQGPFISNAAIGLLAQEGATGHSDYVTYEDCVDAIRCTVNARVNYSGSEFARCTRAVRVDANGVTYGPGADFNNGTAGACDENIVQQTGGRDITIDLYANTGQATEYNAAFDLTGSAVSTNIVVRTIAQGTLCPNVNSIRKPVHFKLIAYGSFTGTATTKQLKIRLGATILASATIGAAYAGPWWAEGKITLTDSNVQTASLIVHLHGVTANAAGVPYTALSVDLVGSEDIAAADVDLSFEAQLGAAVADHIICSQGAAHFELWG